MECPKCNKPIDLETSGNDWLYSNKDGSKVYKCDDCEETLRVMADGSLVVSNRKRPEVEDSEEKIEEFVGGEESCEDDVETVVRADESPVVSNRKRRKSKTL